MRLMRAVVVTATVLFTLGGCQYMPWYDKKPAAATTAPSAKPKAAKEKEPTRTLYDRIGGESAIRAVINDFAARAAADEKVNFARKGVPGHEWQATPENVQKVKERLVQFVCVATGGPQKYEGQDMGTVHKGMQITGSEFDAIAADLKQSLDAVKVPPREQKELLDIVASTRGVIVEKP
jgi:hemoglobin